jgi:hypothetical protein
MISWRSLLAALSMNFSFIYNNNNNNNNNNKKKKKKKRDHYNPFHIKSKV